MKRTIFYLFIISVFLNCSISKKNTTSINNENFPSTWLGEYEGKLAVFRPGKEGNPYPANVHLSISPTPEASRWEWSTTYIIEGRDPIEKKYFIMHPDSLPPSTYLMDEDNGIFINQYYSGNTFYGAYTVNEQFFTFIYHKEEDVLNYELTVYNRNPYETVEPEEGFNVGKIDLITVQKIKFKKVK